VYDRAENLKLKGDAPENDSDHDLAVDNRRE
jgi:hypothetical protein